ncbi:DNA repair protein, partial [Methanosarcinales archaeon]
MMLTELRLKNVKSYRDATIEFKPGINGITGENGHGKTTILEAIGYALFDYLPYPERNFIRHDTQSGSVELDFLSDDEIIYTITRKIGGSDIKLSTPIGKITGKKDVMDWLIDNLFPFAGDQRGLRSIFE